MVKSEPLTQADRQIALLLFALASAFFARMAAPDLLAGDPGEFQFAAWTFGLAHPTGYPLYLMLGGLWQHLLTPVGVSPARALNLFSALAGGAAVALLFLLLRRWLTGPVVLARAAAVLAALMLLFNPTFWSQSLLAEVYTLHAVFVLLILLAAQTIEIAAAGDGPVAAGRYLLVAFVTGLALTHHGMTLLLLPGLILYLVMVDKGWWRSPVRLLSMGAAFLMPLALYLYIPLRSGPDASPWYHQRLGDGVLTLYDGSAQAFWTFVTGQSISVGFLSVSEALARLGQAGALWRLHFYWPGLILMVAGLVILLAGRRWAVLALTLTYVILQQLFNLFYAIDDILVYYSPIYIMAVLWIGFAADWMVIGVESGLAAVDSPKPVKPDAEDAIEPAQDSDDDVDVEGAAPHLSEGRWPGEDQPLEMAAGGGSEKADAEAQAPEGHVPPRQMQRYVFSMIVVLVLALLPWRLFSNYQDVLDQSGERTAREMWEAILAADPPPDSILISNDRNEIVPLFYLQAVEERASSMTGLFPLIEPGLRFADLGAVIDTALEEGAPQPVVLIKEMPGLEVKYRLDPLDPPLVRVEGLIDADAPAVPVDAPLGPLTLLGYDLWPEGGDLRVRLHWRVDALLPDDYTTTVQIFDLSGDKAAQSDAPAGGPFYPTTIWQLGDRLVEEHLLAGAESAVAGDVSDGVDATGELLIGMYSGPDFQQLAEPLVLPLAPGNR